MLQLPRSSSSSSLRSPTPSSSPYTEAASSFSAFTSDTLKAKVARSRQQSSDDLLGKEQNSERKPVVFVSSVAPNGVVAHIASGQKDGRVDANTDSITDTAPVMLIESNHRRRAATVMQDEQRRHEQHSRPQQHGSSPANHVNHFFTPGTCFSPPCSRIGLSSSPSSVAAISSPRNDHHRSAQYQDGAYSNVAPSPEDLPRRFLQERQRTFSNLGNNGSYLQDRSHPSSASSPKSSIFRPILNIIAATTSANAVQQPWKNTHQANKSDRLAASLSNDDLPSPIYNHDRSDDEESGKAPRTYRVVFGSISTPESSEVFLSASKEGEVTLKNLELRATATSSDADVNQYLMDTPLLDQQECGYVSVKDTTAAREFEEEQQRLQQQSSLSVETHMGEGRQQGVPEHMDQLAVLPMSATLEARYCAPSVSVENLELSYKGDAMEVEAQGRDLEAEQGVVDEILQAVRERPSILCLHDLVPHELKEMEYQVSQEVDVVTKSNPYEEEQDDDENVKVICIDYDDLLRGCAEEEQQRERERQLWRQLCRTGGLQLDLGIEQGQETGTEGEVFNVMANSCVIDMGEVCDAMLQPSMQLELEMDKVAVQRQMVPLVKRVQFDPDLHIITYVQNAFESTGTEIPSEQESEKASPGWIPLIAFQPELAPSSRDDQETSRNVLSDASQQWASSVPLPSSPQMESALDNGRIGVFSFIPVRLLPPLPSSPEVNQDNIQFALSDPKTPLHWLPPLPASPEFSADPAFVPSHLLPPLPASPDVTLHSVFVPIHLLPPLPASPQCDTAFVFPALHIPPPLPSLPPSDDIFIFPVLNSLPPLPASPILEKPRAIITVSPLVPEIITSSELLSSVDCTSPRSLELATARTQLLHWTQTAARLRDQEQVLTDRIDQLVEELADVLQGCQDTEMGLEETEYAVQELKQVLMKEQEIGFASIQEAALSIQEKQLLESALEESWKELDILRAAWVEQQLELERTATGAHQEQHQPQLQQQSLKLITKTPSMTSMTRSTVRHKRPASGATTSETFQSLVKYVCLMLVAAVTLSATALLIHAYQHQLRQGFDVLVSSVSDVTSNLDTKIDLNDFLGLTRDKLGGVWEAMLSLKKQMGGSEQARDLVVLIEKTLLVARGQAQWASEVIQPAVDLWMELDLESALEGFRVTRTWS